MGDQQPVGGIPGCRGEKIDQTLRVEVDGYLYSADGRTKFRDTDSGAKFLSGLRFKCVASTNAGNPYEVSWQVVNTGAHARQAERVRRNFFKGKLADEEEGSNPLVNWERSEYTGRH